MASSSGAGADWGSLGVGFMDKWVVGTGAGPGAGVVALDPKLHAPSKARAADADGTVATVATCMTYQQLLLLCVLKMLHEGEINSAMESGVLGFDQHGAWTVMHTNRIAAAISYTNSVAEHLGQPVDTEKWCGQKPPVSGVVLSDTATAALRSMAQDGGDGEKVVKLFDGHGDAFMRSVTKKCMNAAIRLPRVNAPTTQSSRARI